MIQMIYYNMYNYLHLQYLFPCFGNSLFYTFLALLCRSSSQFWVPVLSAVRFWASSQFKFVFTWWLWIVKRFWFFTPFSFVVSLHKYDHHEGFYCFKISSVYLRFTKCDITWSLAAEFSITILRGCFRSLPCWPTLVIFFGFRAIFSKKHLTYSSSV